MGDPMLDGIEFYWNVRPGTGFEDGPMPYTTVKDEGWTRALEGIHTAVIAAPWGIRREPNWPSRKVTEKGFSTIRAVTPGSPEEVVRDCINPLLLDAELWRWVGGPNRLLAFMLPAYTRMGEEALNYEDDGWCGLRIVSALIGADLRVRDVPAVRESELAKVEAIDRAWLEHLKGTLPDKAFEVTKMLKPTERTKRLRRLGLVGVPPVGPPTLLARPRGTVKAGRIVVAEIGQGRVVVALLERPGDKGAINHAREGILKLKYAIQSVEKGVPLPVKGWTFHKPAGRRQRITVLARGVDDLDLSSEHGKFLKEIYDAAPNAVPYEKLWSILGHDLDDPDDVVNPRGVQLVRDRIAGKMRTAGMKSLWVTQHFRADPGVGMRLLLEQEPEAR